MNLPALLERVRWLLRRRGQVGEEADDLIPEAFLRLHEYRRSRSVLEPEAFLVRTVQNLSIDVHRAKARRGTQVAVEDEIHRLIDPAPRPDEVLDTQQRLQHLRRGLETLAPRTREVVLLYRIDGLSQSQIGARLGISVSAVEKHIAKAALFLMDWMAKERT